jgi:hypothetical protein
MDINLFINSFKTNINSGHGVDDSDYKNSVTYL